MSSEFGQHMFGQGGLNDQIAVTSLVNEVGLDKNEIQWRKEFIGFDEEDSRRLERYKELFESHSDEIPEAFYENLTEHDETLEIISRSPKNVTELKRTQSAYLVTLAQGTYENEYFQN